MTSFCRSTHALRRRSRGEAQNGATPACFASAAGAHRLADVQRYLVALERRLEKLPAAPQRDVDLMARVQDLEDHYARQLVKTPA